jgi:uncharacterized protein YcnI
MFRTSKIRITIRTLALGTFASLCVAMSSVAHAHVTLESREAPVGANYKAVMRVPHGCDGTATTSVRIRMPEGFIAVKPMPKPGWKLDVVKGKYPKTYNLQHGVTLTEGVTEVAWSAGNLPDAYYDEFVFTGTIADDLKAGQTIYFPVVQECEKGVHRWIEIPAGGHDHGETREPAPALRLSPKR